MGNENKVSSLKRYKKEFNVCVLLISERQKRDQGRENIQRDNNRIFPS